MKRNSLHDRIEQILFIIVFVIVCFYDEIRESPWAMFILGSATAVGIAYLFKN